MLIFVWAGWSTTNNIDLKYSVTHWGFEHTLRQLLLNGFSCNIMGGPIIMICSCSHCTSLGPKKCHAPWKLLERWLRTEPQYFWGELLRRYFESKKRRVLETTEAIAKKKGYSKKTAVARAYYVQASVCFIAIIHEGSDDQGLKTIFWHDEIVESIFSILKTSCNKSLSRVCVCMVVASTSIHIFDELSLRIFRVTQFNALK